MSLKAWELLPGSYKHLADGSAKGVSQDCVYHLQFENTPNICMGHRP